MNLNNFLSKNIFKQLILFYLMSLILFTSIRVFDFFRETNRFYSLTKNYIHHSTEQLINEGDLLRLQMNIDQFLGLNNKENPQIICPRVYLNNRLIASAECNGIWTYSKSALMNLSNGQSLKIDFRMDGSHFIINNLIIIFLFLLILTFVFYFIKKSIDHFSIQITHPLLKWSEWAKNLNFQTQFEIPNFSEDELKITEFENFNKFNQKAFEIQNDIFRSKLTEEKAKIEIELAKSVSHDIRSPLIALSNMANEISFQSKESKLLFNDTLTRIEKIANDLLKKTIKRNIEESFSGQLNNLLQEKLLQYRDKKLQLINLVQEAPPLFLPNLNDKLLRVISNLLNNAIESQLNKETIIVTTKLSFENKIYKIEVIDLGPGIPPEIQKTIGLNIVSHKEDNHNSGSGIGLFNAYHFIQEQGGKIFYDSHEKGTHFTIIFPQLPSQIILVDDDRLIHLTWMKESIKNGIQLHSYYNSVECLQSISHYPKDTPIFLDYFLGNCNGVELAKELYQLGFKQLYLQSGLEEVEKPDFILDVFSKDYPFKIS